MLMFPATIQAVADAYYVLSDPTRRREYDILYSSRSYKDRTDDPKASSNFFTTFANMFASAGETAEEARPAADDQFANVFEEV